MILFLLKNLKTFIKDIFHTSGKIFYLLYSANVFKVFLLVNIQYKITLSIFVHTMVIRHDGTPMYHLMKSPSKINLSYKYCHTM